MEDMNRKPSTFSAKSKLTIGQHKILARNFAAALDHTREATGFHGICARGNLRELKDIITGSIGDSQYDVDELAGKLRNTPIYTAISAHHPEMVEVLLLDGSADPDPQNAEDETPLMYAIMNNDIKSFIMLLDYGADPNKKNFYGNNALHFTASWGRQEMAEILLGQRDAEIPNFSLKKRMRMKDVKATNSRKESAYAIAVLGHHDKVAASIKRAGGETEVREPGDRMYESE